MSHASLPGIESIGTDVRAIGLILYNNDAHCIEGLWVAVERTHDFVHWEAVAEYSGVPSTVYGSVVSLAPYKNLYVGSEALAIGRMLWEWKSDMCPNASHSNVLRDNMMLPSQAPGLPVVPSSSTSDGANSTTMTRSLSSFIMSTPAAIGATSHAPVQDTVQRQLPPHLALMVNRPGLVGGVQTSMVRPTRPMCTMCKCKPANWLVLKTCNHWGPCGACLPKPIGMVNNKYESPVDYHVCLMEVGGHICRKLVSEMVWVTNG